MHQVQPPHAPGHQGLRARRGPALRPRDAAALYALPRLPPDFLEGDPRQPDGQRSAGETGTTGRLEPPRTWCESSPAFDNCSAGGLAFSASVKARGGLVGRLAQRESTCLTSRGSVVRIDYRPPCSSRSSSWIYSRSRRSARSTTSSVMRVMRDIVGHQVTPEIVKTGGSKLPLQDPAVLEWSRIQN